MKNVQAVVLALKFVQNSLSKSLKMTLNQWFSVTTKTKVLQQEKHVKLAAKELYNTLTEKRNELFIVGWQNDPQPKERVRGEIVYILNKFLPESYDREIFLRKSTLVFDHIVDQAITGYNWVA